ncbi:hypothetical protein [Paractinoplanes deccanensis]|nr:hypothetical protein [Actinoplanes deccanensis]
MRIRDRIRRRARAYPELPAWEQAWRAPATCERRLHTDVVFLRQRTF